jgi:hypothetical protein
VSDRPKHRRRIIAVQCEPVCLSPSTREPLPPQRASVSSDRSAQDRGFAHLTAPNSKALIKTTTSGGSVEVRDREVVPIG